MDKLYEELFRSMNQFRKLKFSEMFPEVCKTDYFVLCTIMDKGENGQITISELAARAKMLPPAISRTLKGLEERGYVERNVNKHPDGRDPESGTRPEVLRLCSVLHLFDLRNNEYPYVFTPYLYSGRFLCHPG